jgi:hypothetical protein
MSIAKNTNFSTQSCITNQINKQMLITEVATLLNNSNFIRTAELSSVVTLADYFVIVASICAITNHLLEIWRKVKVKKKSKK